MFLRAVSSGSSLHAHMIYQGSTLQLTHFSRMEYPTLFSWTSPLPFWFNIQYYNVFTDHVCCQCVKDYNLKALAGYGLPPPPPRGHFVHHIFLEAQCLAKILQHVSSLTMAALSCNSMLHMLPYKIFDN